MSSSLIACESPLLRQADDLVKDGYERALHLLISSAQQSSDGKIENKIGLIYHFGESVRDYKAAQEWYLKAVEKGNGEAANHLGRLYVNGEGVASNKKLACKWYKKGSELGDKDAEENYSSLKCSSLMSD